MNAQEGQSNRKGTTITRFIDRMHKSLLLVSVTITAGTGGVNAMEDANFIELPNDRWRLVTDGVMGGVSRGTMTVEEIDGRSCIALRGHVSTKNNGGFIQAALDLDEPLRDAGGFDGIRLDVTGNGESYNVHLRTADLWLPWQSYRAAFQTSSEWSTVFLPFSEFEAYRTTTVLKTDRLRRIGIVAIGRDFDAEVCFTRVAYQRTPR